jgi:hypothetical protein
MRLLCYKCVNSVLMSLAKNGIVEKKKRTDKSIPEMF